MPDYNRTATLYWWLMVLVGCATLAASLASLASRPGDVWFQVAVGAGLAMAAGLFPLKIPRTNQVFALGDVVIVMLLLSHGPAAACVAASVEALVSAWRSSRRWTTRLGSATIAATTMIACGHALTAITPWLDHAFRAEPATQASLLIVTTATFGLVHAACNALLMSMVAHLKRSQALSWSVLMSVFGWVGGASAAAAAAAASLHVLQRVSGIGMLLAVAPTVLMAVISLHFLARRQEAEGAARIAEAQALQHKADLDVSQARQRQAEMAADHLRALERSDQRFHSAFTHASIGMALLSERGIVELANPALGELLGVQAVDLAGRPLADVVITPGSVDVLLCGSTTPLEVSCRHADAREVWASLSCARFAAAGMHEASYIVQLQDITARRLAQAQLHHRAFHDKLTGLPNRDRFLLELTASLESRADNRLFAVMFLDFDRFKLVNDTRGHDVGDAFLVQASARLAGALRQGDLLARLGGDEFAILARGLDTHADAIGLAERLQCALREPLPLGSFTVSASVSIGITFSSIGYQHPDEMLRDADIAMYRAKQEGKARHALFDVTLHQELTARVRLETDLRDALRQGQLRATYQPIYDLASGSIVAFEALCRWEHPSLGIVSPATFIPIAEDSPLILEITDFMLERACSQLAAWQRKHPGTEKLQIHVNASARDSSDPRFGDRVHAALAASALDPRCLVIELTEGTLLDHLTAALVRLADLRDAGVRFAVDDFGTGYSSLAHLSRLPIDGLKIDMSFIRGLTQGSKDAAVVRAIVSLGASLGKTVVAEGVETPEQAAQLRAMGCEQAQGYLLGRPGSAQACERLLEATPASSPAISASTGSPTPTTPTPTVSTDRRGEAIDA